MTRLRRVPKLRREKQYSINTVLKHGSENLCPTVYVKKGLLESRKHSRADLIKLKESFVLIQDITMVYGLSSLSEIF